MKLPKNGLLVAIIIFLCLAILLVAFMFLRPRLVQKTKVERPMPDVMRSLAQDENVDWMAGLWVDIENYPINPTRATETIDVYEYDGGEIEAVVTVQNGLESEQDYYFMLFSDGIPIEFRIGEKYYQKQDVTLTNEPTSVELTITPLFNQNLGRLDVVLIYDEDPLADFYLTSYSLWMDQPKEAIVPVDSLATIPQRSGLRDRFLDGAYSAWVWPESAEIEEESFIAPREISISRGDEILLEVIASSDCSYRTSLFIDGNPLLFCLGNCQEESTYFDWTSHSTDMFQRSILLTESSVCSGSFYTISIPLSTELSLPVLASPKIKISVA